MANKVSIIATVWNEEKNISILLDALLKQTFRFHEIVINDNGSTDNTVNIVKKYQGLDSRIKLVEGRGISIGVGRNNAIAHSNGDIIAVIDAGICPVTTWLEKVVEPLMKDPDLDVAWGNVIFDAKSRIVPSTILSQALVFMTKYPENRKCGKNVPSSAIRRRVWEEMGKFPEIKVPIEDLLLIDHLTKGPFKVISVKEAIAYYFSYPRSYFQVFRKWIGSAYSSCIARKSELGFYKQLVKFAAFFIFIPLVIIDCRFVLLLLLYMLLFFTGRYINNRELGNKVFTKPRLLLASINLFFVLNVARLIGFFKAIFKVYLTGRRKSMFTNYARQKT